MPSLPLSDSMLTETTPKDKKEKKSKKMKNNGETLETADSPISEKKSKTKKTKETKKRKALEMDEEEEEERSGTSSELVEPVSSKKSVAEESEKKSKKNKKAKVEDGEEEEVKSVEEDPNAVSRFRISAPLKAKLKEKGIEALFPIQAMTFDTILDGSDLVGRARTGQVFLSLHIYLHMIIYVLNLINWEAIFEASKVNIELLSMS